jgi:hypothetical protein
LILREAIVSREIPTTATEINARIVFFIVDIVQMFAHKVVYKVSSVTALVDC